MSGDRSRIVIDGGSGFVKCGFAGSNFPTAIIPSMVGRPLLRAKEKIGQVEIKDVVVGQDCADLRSLLEVNYPIKNGVVTNWTDMEVLWDHCIYDHLKIDPKETKVMLTEPPMNPIKNTSKSIEIMFEKYGFEAVKSEIQAVLALYAQGLTTGLVLDCGDGVSNALPVYEGYLIGKGIKRLPVAGSEITELLIKLLCRRGYAFNRTADFDTVRQVKEKFCYCAVDLKLEHRLAFETTHLEKSYTLPDGQVLRIGSERFEATEALFKPHLVDVEGEGLANTLFSSIQACDMDVRSSLYQQVVLSGGTTMFPGLPTRLSQEVRELFIAHALKGDRSKLQQSSWKLEITDPPRRKHMVFLGGAVLASLLPADRWMKKSDYNELGIEKLLASQSG